jgi:outer membrane protein OmpA-like peptidoglycan-associated protein
VGVSWGHRWNFAERWGIEVTAAVGYLYKDYERYECRACGRILDDHTKNYFGPTEIGVNLIFGGGGKVAPVIAPPPPAPVAAPVVAPPVVREPYAPRFTPGFIVPAVEPVKVRAETGSAYLEFATGRSEIVPTFRNNATELERIHESIRSVNADADATITGIRLVGHASPEGTASSNMSLSQRRAQTLKTYLNGIYGFRSDFIQASGEGEDWATLGRLVEESILSGKQSLLSIIEGSGDPDSKDRQMAALSGDSYRTMMAELYPRLRRTDYQIDFEVVPISIERGKQIMRTNPRNLSLNELFLIANTYQPGSAEFREVMDIAARTFPDSDVANCNAAAAAIQRGDFSAAASFLGNVKNHDADWNNNMGIVAFMQGNPTAAAGYFRAAGAKGSANAAELQKHLESIR